MLRLRNALSGLIRTPLTRHTRKTTDSTSVEGGLPVPPPELVHLVTNQYDPVDYLEFGAKVAGMIKQQLARNGLRLEDFERVLDFGCGTGRLLRHFAKSGPSFFACDYNASQIAWARQNLPVAEYEVNGPLPPLKYPDGAFDFIYAFSVFTHFSGEQQAAWISDLTRVLKDGGYMYLTFHGDAYLDQMPPSMKETYLNGGLVVRDAEWAGTNGCAAFHPEDYVRNVLCRGLEVIDFAPSLFPQDAYLVRKPAREG